MEEQCIAVTNTDFNLQKSDEQDVENPEYSSNEILPIEISKKIRKL